MRESDEREVTAWDMRKNGEGFKDAAPTKRVAEHTYLAVYSDGRCEMFGPAKLRSGKWRLIGSGPREFAAIAAFWLRCFQARADNLNNRPALPEGAHHALRGGFGDGYFVYPPVIEGGT